MDSALMYILMQTVKLDQKWHVSNLKLQLGINFAINLDLKGFNLTHPSLAKCGILSPPPQQTQTSTSVGWPKLAD